jgi:hypothetical protein
MKLLPALLLVFVLFSCKNDQQKNSVPEESSVRTTQDTVKSYSGFKKYRSEQWSFTAEIPAHYDLAEMQLAAKTPVVNIYDTTNVKAPPYAIHEDAALSYIAVLPEGYGVDAPAGKQITYREWQGDINLNFEVDGEQSVIYLLENDEVWAYSFRLKYPPQGWNEYGSIFVHLKVDNYAAKCFDVSSGGEKSMSNCMPMGGSDQIKYFGKVDPESEEDLLKILSTIEFGK